MDISFKVYVRCYTFNQAAYIEDTLNGFCSQETNFPFLCGIIDDASTDDNHKVISNYLTSNFDVEGDSAVKREETDDYHLVLARHKTNKNCYFLVIYLKYNHYSIKKPKLDYQKKWRDQTEYEAICEGDDYWTDPLKLQKQVEFMETHPEHSMCFHAYVGLLADGTLRPSHRYNEDMEVCPIDDAILDGGGYCATNSLLYNLSSYGDGYKNWAKDCPVGDLPMTLTLFAKGKVGYIDDEMSVYRISAVGSWSQRMVQSTKKRWEHHHKIIKMWKVFDNWTERKHHKTIRKKIRYNRICHYKDVISHFIHKL